MWCTALDPIKLKTDIPVSTTQENANSGFSKCFVFKLQCNRRTDKWNAQCTPQNGCKGPKTFEEHDQTRKKKIKLAGYTSTLVIIATNVT